jgi:hypothetical protein
MNASLFFFSLCHDHLPRQARDKRKTKSNEETLLAQGWLNQAFMPLNEPGGVWDTSIYKEPWAASPQGFRYRTSSGSCTMAHGALRANASENLGENT